MKSSLKLAALAAALMTASSASAITFYFGSGGTESGSYWNNTRTFTEDGLSVTASARSFDPASSAWHSGHLGRNSYGLTNWNSSNDNTHYIDNSGWIDFVLFEFSETVSLKQIYTYVEYWSQGDFNYWLSTSPGTPPTGGINVNHNDTGWADLSGITDYLLIGAEPPNRYSNVNFKIKKLKVDRAPRVPDSGATISLLGLALTGLALASRRRR